MHSLTSQIASRTAINIIVNKEKDFREETPWPIEPSMVDTFGSCSNLLHHFGTEATAFV
jgi:hypothetical protein